jgi:hypothetical protein
MKRAPVLLVGLLAASCSEPRPGPGSPDDGLTRRDAVAVPDVDAALDSNAASEPDGVTLDDVTLDDVTLDDMLDGALDDALDDATTAGDTTRLPDAPAARDVPAADTRIGPPVFATPPTPTSFETQLTCNVPFAQALRSVVQVGMIGTDVTSVVGVDDQFAGIGAKFELLNNDSPGNYVNVVEARSGAGAGWQTSSLTYDNPGGVGIIVFNQAAGNSVGTQWGYRNRFSENGSSIYSLGWNPLYSDHIHEVAGGHSPCNRSGYVFDDGAVHILGARVQTPHGVALAWRNQYSFRSRVQQSWPNWSIEQAFYLSRPVARAGNLRLYLRRGATMHGPIRPYDSFSIPSATCDQVRGSHCNTLAYDYALLVWNIFGRDIGVAIPDLNAVSLNLETVTYCSNAANDSCGNINFHSWLRRGGAASFATGQIRTYGQVYYVGTLPQLADLGYTL